MLNFRPYGSHEARVISDLSRFDYESISARNRSRNPTPTSIDDEKSSVLTLDTIIPLYSSRINKEPYHPPKTLLEIAENLSPLPKARPPPLPEKDGNLLRSQSAKEFAPYPESVYDESLPPMMETSQFVEVPKTSQESVSLETLNSKQKALEEDLVRRVMNRPLFTISGRDLGVPKYEDKSYTISANSFIYLFEIIIDIIIIVLSSVLVNKDRNVGVGIYRYFIADGSISLIISLLFISTIINFEKRNGSFYCLAATILKLVSFIMVVSHLLPKGNCKTRDICDTRKATSAFIIISTFIWIGNLVMFLTTLYISRLNLLNDINFDFSNQGLNKKYNMSQDTLHEQGSPNNHTDKPLKEYYLTESGEMYEITDEWQRLNHQGKNKILVYTF